MGLFNNLFKKSENTNKATNDNQSNNKKLTDQQERICSNPSFNHLQEQQLRLGFMHGINANIYAHPNIDEWEMGEIRTWLEQGLEEQLMLFPYRELNYMTLKEIRQWVLAGRLNDILKDKHYLDDIHQLKRERESNLQQSTETMNYFG